jgi:hypothetical protein
MRKKLKHVHFDTYCGGGLLSSRARSQLDTPQAKLSLNQRQFFPDSWKYTGLGANIKVQY